MKNESSEPTVFGLVAPSLDKASRPIAMSHSLLVMSLLVFLCPVMISAQAVSGVTGTVTDTNGGAVAGAQVTLTDTKTSRELTVTTNDEGSYTFNNVQPGDGYRLSFTAPGFQGFVIDNVQLGIGRTETQNADCGWSGRETVMLYQQAVMTPEYGRMPASVTCRSSSTARTPDSAPRLSGGTHRLTTRRGRN